MQSFPASLAQRRLWFSEQLSPDSAINNVTSSLRLQIPLNTEAFKLGLDAIVQRHDVLRTAIMAVGEQPMQILAPSLMVSLPMLDLRDLAKTEQEAEIRRLIIQETRQPFDVKQ